MNKLSSILGGVAVIAIIVVFILQFRPATGAAKSSSGPTCAVEVNGTCISAPWFWASYRLIAPNADVAKLRAMNFRKKVADGLVEAWVLNQDAKRLGITVADDDARAEIAKGRAHVSLPAADLRPGEDLVRFIPVKNAKTKQFDLKVYEKEVPRRTHLSVKDFLEYQKFELVAARMRELVMSHVRIADDEAYERYVRDKATASLEYVRFDRRFFADVVVDPSQKSVDTWATGHKEEIDKVWEARKAQVMPECRTFRQIEFKLEDGATDDEKAIVRGKIDRARARILTGQSFADVARAVGDGATASHGGLEGCLLKGKLAKPVEDAVVKAEVGKVSDVITTDRSMVIVLVDEVAKDDAAEQAGRGFVAREIYLAQESERLAAEAAKAMLANAKNGKPLNEVVDAYIDEVAKAHEAAPSDKAEGNDKAPKKTKKADKKGETSDASKAGDAGTGEAKVDEDRPAITARNHPNRPMVESTLPFNANGNPISGAKQPGDIARIAFGLEKPGDLAGDLAPLDNGYAIMKLKEKTPVAKEQWERDKELYLGNMRTVKAQDALAAYVARLRQKYAKDTKYIGEVVDEPKASSKDQGPAPSDDDQGE